MAEKPIPNEHHVVRHCPRNRTIRENGVVVGVQPRLFALRAEKGEDYLSASYWEYFEGDEADRLKESVSSIPRPIPKDDYLVKLNVGTIKSIGTKYSLSIRVLHEKNHPTNKAYAKIKGTPIDAASVFLAELSNSEVSQLISAAS